MENIKRVSLALMLALSVSPFSAEARDRREKRKLTAEEWVQSCLSNTQGLMVNLRSLLNERRNPLAENVKATDWNKYCACYAPRAGEIADAKPPGNLPPAEFQKFQGQLNAVSEECASKSIPANVPAAPQMPLPRPDSRFEATLQYCKRSPKGYLTNLEVHLKVRKSPRLSGLEKINSDKYCECYVRSLRQRLGDDLALQQLTTMAPTADKDLFKVTAAVNETYDACAAEQIPF